MQVAVVDLWRSRIVAAAVVLTPVVFWAPAASPFHHPKLLVIALAAVGLVAISALYPERLAPARADQARVLVAGGLLALAVTATAMSPTPAVAFWGDHPHGSGLLLYASLTVVLLTVSTLDAAHVDLGLKWLSVALGVVVGYAILQFAGLDPFEWVTSLRGVTGTLGQQNFAAGWLGATVAAVAASALRMPGWTLRRRLATGGVALLGVVALALTWSFQGPVTLAAATLFLAIAAAVPALRRTIPTSHVLAGMAVGLLALGALSVWLFGDWLWGELQDGLRERRLFWTAALGVLADHPLTGTGLDTFGLHFFAYRPAEHGALFGSTNADAPHSVPLSMFTGGGFPLGLLYLAFVALVGWRLLRGLAASKGDAYLRLSLVGSVWVGYQVQSLVSIDVPPLALLHFWSAGIVLALTTPSAVAGAEAHRPLRSAPRSAVALAAGIGLVGAYWLSGPLRADIHVARGFEAAQGGDTRAGLARVERATDIAPYRGLYWFVYAGLLANMGQLEQAQAAAREAARRDPGNSRAALLVAELAEHQGDTALAGAWYEEALARDPHNPGVIEQVLSFYESHGPNDRVQHLRRRQHDLELLRDPPSGQP